MKGKLKPFEWTIVGLMIVVFIGGIMGVMILSGKVSEKKSELESSTASINTLAARMHYPNIPNMEALKENSKAIEGFVISLKPLLQSNDNRLIDVREIEAVEFKQQLSTTADALRALAKAQNVTLPVDFYFGFSRYQKQNPKKTDTVVLSKQLLGIEKLVAQLISFAPSKIENVSRSFEEDGGFKKGGSLEADQLRFPIYRNADGFYVAYPLEVEFVASPQVLQSFVNSLTQSPYLYVVRSIYSSSLKSVPPRLDDLQRQYSASGQPTGTKLPPLVPVLGDEKVKFKVRVDMIEWLGVSEKNLSTEKKS